MEAGKRRGSVRHGGRVGGELRSQLWPLFGRTDRKPSVRYDAGPGISEQDPCTSWVTGSKLSPPNFLIPSRQPLISIPATLSFMTFLFLEFVDQSPTSGPLHLLFLLPQNISRDWLSTSGFGLNVTSLEGLSLSTFLFFIPIFLAHPLIHSSA